MPAAASAALSSPPRPNTNGSPPLSRSTRRPARASSTSRRLMSACVAEGLPPRLPANSSRACRPASASTRAIDQRVVDDHLGLLQAGERVERQQPGIARPGARKPDMAGREHRHAGRARAANVSHAVMRFARPW